MDITLGLPEPMNAPDLTARECPCADPDDQYLLEIDAGSVYLVHKACGKQPRSWLDDAFGMDSIPVTLHWHDGRPTHPEDDDNSYGMVTVNGRTVGHDGVPYLVGRDYTDREGAVWRITEAVNAQDQPLVYLLPEGSGEDCPLGEIVADFGPLTLTKDRP